MSIKPDTYRALQAESVVRGKDVNAVLDDLVFGGLSQEAKEFLGMIGQPSAKAEKPKSNKARLTDSPQALQAIKDMWRSGERNRSEIARTIGYPKATVAENIRRMLEAGELAE
jgi:hypothetical protein